MGQLVNANELAKILTSKFQANYTANIIRHMRQAGLIKGINKKRAGSKTNRWFYDPEETIKRLKKIEKEEQQND